MWGQTNNYFFLALVVELNNWKLIKICSLIQWCTLTGSEAVLMKKLPCAPGEGGTRICKWRVCAQGTKRGSGCRISWKKGDHWVWDLKKWAFFWCELLKIGLIIVNFVKYEWKFAIFSWKNWLNLQNARKKCEILHWNFWKKGSLGVGCSDKQGYWV